MGPYTELAVAEPARLGLRPGFCVVTMVVSSADSRVAGVVNWGFPKEVGSLTWAPAGEGAELWWHEREIAVRSQPHGRRGVWAWVPLRNLQRRGDGPVVVPSRLRGRIRRAHVTVDVPAADPLAAYAGRHRGVHVRGLRFVVDPARHPAGLASTLRAPLQAPEPALRGAVGVTGLEPVTSSV